MSYRTQEDVLDDVMDDLHQALTHGELSFVEMDDEEIDAYLRWCGYSGNASAQVLQ